MKNDRYILYMVTALLTVFLVMHPLVAEGKSIVNQKETVVPKHETVDNVITVGTDAHIKGTVKTTLIVVNGDVTIEKSAQVDGLVLVAGGDVHIEPGATVTDNIVHLQFNNETKNSFILAGIVTFGSTLLTFILSVMIVLLVLLSGLLFKDKWSQYGSFSSYTGKILLTGAIALIALCAILFILFVTIVGIPVGLILILLMFIIFIIGLSFFVFQFTKQIKFLEGKPLWFSLFIGSLFIVSIVHFPVLGLLFLLLILWYSIGFVILVLYQKMKKRRRPI